MKLTVEEAAARIAASPGDDACILRIEDGDFGCEEYRDPPCLWLMVQTADGERFSREMEEPRVEALGLTEGCTCRLDIFR